MIEYISTGESGFFNICNDERKKREKKGKRPAVPYFRSAEAQRDALLLAPARPVMTPADADRMAAHNILYGWYAPRP